METLLEEYVSRFYLLIEISYKIDAQHALEQIHIQSIQNYKEQSDRSDAINQYRKQADLGDVEDSEPLISKLKKRTFHAPKKSVS